MPTDQLGQAWQQFFLQDKVSCKQAGAELGKAQPKLGLGKIKINLALVKSRKVV